MRGYYVCKLHVYFICVPRCKNTKHFRRVMFWIVTQCWVFDTCSTSYQGLLQPGSFNFDMTDSIFENVAQNFIWLFLNYEILLSDTKTKKRLQMKDPRFPFELIKVRNQIFWGKKEFKNIMLQTRNISFDLTS